MFLKSAYGSAISYSGLSDLIYSFVRTARFLTINAYTIYALQWFLRVNYRYAYRWHSFICIYVYIYTIIPFIRNRKPDSAVP